MNRGLLVLLLALAVPLAALAQDVEPGAADSETAIAEPAMDADYVRYEAADFGFGIKLPDGGILTDPADPEWGEDEAVAFIWQAAGTEPIQLILGRVDTFDAPVDEMTFNIVCGTMLESWEDDPASFTIITANEKLKTSSGSGATQREWNLIEVADTSNSEGLAVHYSMFSTYAGNSVYSVTMYYLEPVNTTIRQFGIPVIYSFELAN